MKSTSLRAAASFFMGRQQMIRNICRLIAFKKRRLSGMRASMIPGRSGFWEHILERALAAFALLVMSGVYAGAVSAIGTFPASIDVADLDGTNGFSISPTGSTPHLGRTVSGAGDFNGDGIADLVIGDPGAARPPGGFAKGQAYIIFGIKAGFPANINVSTLDGTNGFTVTGTIQLAESVSNAGDINNDGIDDIIISERVALSRRGRAFVIYGVNTASAGDFPSNIDLPADLNGSNGFEIRGVANGDLAGASVSGAGDINGDGINDLIIGATQAALGGFPQGTGAAFVVFGRDTGQAGDFPSVFELAALDGQNGFSLRGIYENDRTGSHVSGAGDVDGDGVGDLVISTGFQPRTYVVFGRNTAGDGDFPANLNLSDLNGANGFVITGDDADSIGAAGDVNHDGVGDLILGQPARSGPTERGRAYIVYGKDVAKNGGFEASFDLSDLNGSNGFKVIGVPPPSGGIDGVGQSVAGVGDLNNDGIDDISIKNGPFGQDETYMVFGRNTANTGEFPSQFYLTGLDGANGFVIQGTGDTTFGPGGPRVAKAGDVNDDGIDDLVIGSGEETAYVVFGRADTMPINIDIKPGNKRNTINPRAKGGIWVAVLSDTNPESPFDPSSQVDIPTVEFGPDGAKTIRHKVKDINKDGLGDLLLRFKISQTGIACGDTEATLIGETFDGQSITGTDSIKTVGCKKK